MLLLTRLKEKIVQRHHQNLIGDLKKSSDNVNNKNESNSSSKSSKGYYWYGRSSRTGSSSSSSGSKYQNSKEYRRGYNAGVAAGKTDKSSGKTERKSFKFPGKSPNYVRGFKDGYQFGFNS